MLQMAGRMSALGTETAFEVLARANALAAQGRSIINLGIGQPDFPTPEHIVEAGRKALADGHTITREGVTYYFCSDRCKRKFSEQPEHYLAANPSGPHS